MVHGKGEWDWMNETGQRQGKLRWVDHLEEPQQNMNVYEYSRFFKTKSNIVHIYLITLTIYFCIIIFLMCFIMDEGIYIGAHHAIIHYIGYTNIVL